MPRSRSATCAARFSPGLSRSTPSLPCPAPGSWPPRWTAGSGLNFLLYMDILMEAGREWNWPEIRGQRMNRPASSSSPAARNASRTATPSALSSTSTNRWTGGAGSGPGDKSLSAPPAGPGDPAAGQQDIGAAAGYPALCQKPEPRHGGRLSQRPAAEAQQCRRHCRAQQEKRSIHDRIRFTAQSSYPLLFGMIVPRCWASPHSSFWQRHLYLLYFPWSQPAPEHFVTFSWGGP